MENRVDQLRLMNTAILWFFSAMRDDLTKLLPIIERLDKPTPQILIKANIVETTKGVARDLGIMWGGYNKVLICLVITILL